jgi:hypothetical protein
MIDEKATARQFAEFRRVAFTNGEPFEDHGHAAQPCDAEGCEAEATYFLCPEPGKDAATLAAAKYGDTYLCADCCEARYWSEAVGWEYEDDGNGEPSGELVPPTPDPFATPRQAASGRPREAWDAVKLDDGVCYEFGAYCCHEDCPDCN